ncbi:MAG: acetylglutamate kinase, partial [Nakamurella sp.]
MSATAVTVTAGDAAARAAVLVDALPWLERYRGRIVVVKFGGNAMTDDTLKTAFAADMV